MTAVPPSARSSTTLRALPSTRAGKIYVSDSSNGRIRVLVPPHTSLSAPTISLVANAFGESTTIAPNTWVEIKGANLAPPGDVRTWQGSDFLNSQLPTALDGVSVTMGGKNAYVYYISSNQINVLTPPDLPPLGPVQVLVTVTGVASQAFASQAQPISPSFFVLNGGPYVTAVHANAMLIGPPSLYPGLTSPAKPGEAIVLYANGFGQIVPAGGPRIGIANGKSPGPSARQDRWSGRDGAIRRFSFARIVSVQRDRARVGSGRGQRRRGNL